MKKCTKCGIEKELSEFHKDKYAKNGIHPVCRKCREKYKKEYRRNNKEKIREYDYKYARSENAKKSKHKYYITKKKNRYKNDLKFRMRITISNYFKDNINKNGKSILYYIEDSSDNVYKYLIETIQENYTAEDWENGELQIDHIIPVSLYNLLEEKEVKKCWNKRNLRLIPKYENKSKSNKLDLELVNKYNIFDLLPEGKDKKGQEVGRI
jgi:hypothetical protein